MNLIGSECVYQALEKGYRVVVLARDPEKLVVPVGSGGSNAGSRLIHESLITITGSVLDQAAVDKTFDVATSCVRGVIVALGGRTKNVGPTMLTEGTKRIVNSMKRVGVKRVAVVTSIGTGDSMKQAPWSFRILMYTVMRKIMADKNNQEKLFLDQNGPGHDLEYVFAHFERDSVVFFICIFACRYTIVRPGQLGEGEPTGIVNVITGQAGQILRADLASFLLRAVNEDDFPYLRQTPCVSSVDGVSWKKIKKVGFDAPTQA